MKGLSFDFKCEFVEIIHSKSHLKFKNFFYHPHPYPPPFQPAAATLAAKLTINLQYIKNFISTTRLIMAFHNDIRKACEFSRGAPCKVLNFGITRRQPARDGSGATQESANGKLVRHRFRSNDTLERATMEQHNMDYLYSDGSQHHFMNAENYEQIALSEEDLGDAAQWLMPGLKIEVEFYDGSPIGVKLPDSMELTSSKPPV